MRLNITNSGSIVGAVVGVVLNGLLYLLFTQILKLESPYVGMGIALAIQVIVFYLIATVTVKHPAGSDEPFITALMRGLLIGINSLANFSLVYLLLTPVIGTAALIPAGIIGGINLLASIGPISQGVVYQALLGWANWIMPMSWLVVALGLGFVLISLIPHPIGALVNIPFLRVGIPAGSPLAGRVFTIDGKTGTLSLYGGWIANLNYIQTAFNMGNFAFVHRNASSDFSQHEAGHTLNLAAFGSVFHLVGALDENLPGIGGGAQAFAELLAESNGAGASSSLLMWE